MPDQVTKLPTAHLMANPFQPRSKIQREEIEELVDSIKQFGILEPLVVAHTPAGYQIIAGERRWRAAQTAGLKEVPVVIRETNRRGMLEMAIVENVQRINLTAIERAQAFQQLAKDFNYNSSEIAKRIGKSPSYVSNTLRLLLLPDAIADGLTGRLISEGHARALQCIHDEDKMIQCYKQILRENANVRRAEELSRHFNQDYQETIKTVSPQTPAKKNNSQVPAALISDEKVREMEKNLKAIFKHRAKVNLSRSDRQTRLTVVLYGGMEETQEDFERILKLAQQAKV